MKIETIERQFRNKPLTNYLYLKLCNRRNFLSKELEGIIAFSTLHNAREELLLIEQILDNNFEKFHLVSTKKKLTNKDKLNKIREIIDYYKSYNNYSISDLEDGYIEIDKILMEENNK